MDEQIQSSGVSPEVKFNSPDLSVGTIISNGFSLGFRHFFPLIGAFILWIITIWIPYLNLGTMVGLYALVVKMSRGEKFSAVEIFNRSYRKIFPEFFVLLAITTIAIIIGFLFFFIPGYILALTWSISCFLLIDKDKGVLDSLKESNKATYGYKWDIFGGLIIISIIFYVIFLIIWLLFRTQSISVDEFGFTQSFSFTLSPIGWIFMIIFGLIFFAIYWGAYAQIYKELSKRI